MPKAFSKHNMKIAGSSASYWEVGKKSDPTILLVHGFRGNHKGLLPIARLLSGYHIIIPDLPGYGTSKPWKKKAHTIEAYAEWLDEFCHALSLHTVTVIGHSFGATLCILFASNATVHINKLILIAPVVASRSVESTLGASYYLLARILPKRIRRRYLINQITEALTAVFLLKSAPLNQRIRLMLDGIANIEHHNEDVIMESFISLYALDPFASAQHITCPTHIIVGLRDSLCTSTSMTRLQRTIPHAACTNIPHEGHLMVIEQPDRVYDAIRSFIYSSPT